MLNSKVPKSRLTQDLYSFCPLLADIFHDVRAVCESVEHICFYYTPIIICQYKQKQMYNIFPYFTPCIILFRHVKFYNHSPLVSGRDKTTSLLVIPVTCLSREVTCYTLKEVTDMQATVIIKHLFYTWHEMLMGEVHYLIHVTNCLTVLSIFLC